MRRLLLAAIGFVIGGSFYLLLIDTTSLPELYVMCGVALLCALMFVVSREQGFAEAIVRRQWLARIGRVLASVPVHIALLCREAVAQLFERRRARGVFRAVPFDAGGDDPEDAGRRALAEALGSLAPNSIVIGVDAEHDLLLVHQLRRQGGREQLDVLRLG